MYGKMQEYLRQTLAEIKEAGLYKEERLIESAQQAAITVKGKEVLNFCANNYLGLSNHPRLIKASQEMMNNRGYGMSSVRFICGTQDIHKELEAAISEYFQTEDTILYAACFDANGGVFEPLFSEAVKGSVLDGVDALYSIIQMPPGIPVATVAINGAMNAAILAIQMLALSDEKLAEAFAAYKEGLKKKIVKANEELKEVKFEYKTN